MEALNKCRSGCWFFSAEFRNLTPPTICSFTSLTFQFGWKSFGGSSDDSLYSPHVNVAIGAAHLRELSDKYDGELILAIANYNAREEAIESWLKNRYRGDVLEFIENDLDGL